MAACTIYLFMVAVTHLNLSINMTLCRTDTFGNNMIPQQQKQYSECSHRSISIAFTYDVFLITPSRRCVPITVTYDVYIIIASHCGMPITVTYDVYIITASHCGMPVTVTYDVYVIAASHRGMCIYDTHLLRIYKRCLYPGL